MWHWEWERRKKSLRVNKKGEMFNDRFERLDKEEGGAEC